MSWCALTNEIQMQLLPCVVRYFLYVKQAATVFYQHSFVSKKYAIQKHVCTHSFVKSLLTHHRFLHTVFVYIDQLLVFLRQEILLRLSVLFPLQPSLLERAQKGQGDFRHYIDRRCV